MNKGKDVLASVRRSILSALKDDPPADWRDSLHDAADALGDLIEARRLNMKRAIALVGRIKKREGPTMKDFLFMIAGIVMVLGVFGATGRCQCGVGSCVDCRAQARRRK